ncbi:unnamed protein product, partial [marine sediment metagenome]
IERTLGLAIYAVAEGCVTFSKDDWYGNPMIVVEHRHDDAPLYARYAHIVPIVSKGDDVKAGQKLGAFANWRTGDHLHFDMALDKFTIGWFTAGVRWVNPVPILKAHLLPDDVDAMMERD